MVRSRCGGKGCGWRDGWVFDIADITSGEERRGGSAEVLYFLALGGLYRNRNQGGGRGGANGLSRRISGIQCSDGSGGGGLDGCVRLGG